ncbi:MAG: hypothetical protein V3R29_10335 [Candidatus Acidoferrales bacterium]
MTGRYEGDQNTGIYVWRYRKVTSKGFTIGPSPNLKTRLADLERQVRHVLTKHKVKISRKTGWPKDKSDLPLSAKPILIDAVAILFRVEAVRRWVDKNHAENAALEAIILGRAVERMSVRPFEPYVKTGKKIKRSARLGGEMRKPPAGMWATWQTKVNDLDARRPDLPFRSIARIVGNEVNRSERTIRKRTKNPREK